VLDALSNITVSGINMLDALLVIIPPVVGFIAGVLLFSRSEKYREARRAEQKRYHRGGTTYPA